MFPFYSFDESYNLSEYIIMCYMPDRTDHRCNELENFLLKCTLGIRMFYFEYCTHFKYYLSLVM